VLKGKRIALALEARLGRALALEAHLGIAFEARKGLALEARLGRAFEARKGLEVAEDGGGRRRALALTADLEVERAVAAVRR